MKRLKGGVGIKWQQNQARMNDFDGFLESYLSGSHMCLQGPQTVSLILH